MARNIFTSYTYLEYYSIKDDKKREIRKEEFIDDFENWMSSIFK